MTEIILTVAYKSFFSSPSRPQLTSVEVTEAFIERCKEINPQLNCVVDQCYEAALKDAAMADKLIASKTLTEEQLAAEKPFLGVPISTKDCIRVKGQNSSPLGVIRR